MKTPTRWLAAASIAALALGTAACSGGQPDAGTSDATSCGSGAPITVNLAWPTQPTTLDPNYETLVMFAQISRNMFDGLFKLDDGMQVQPNLAEGYEQVDDLTYDITLRDDVTFHDGSPFTAADVIATFDRISNDEDLASKQRSYVANVASVEELDEHAVRFTLTQPDASFIKVLATLIYITPGAVIAEGGATEFGRNPVGTGPFKLESWNEGDSVVLAANCDYYGDEPIPSGVEFRFISEPATQISSLQSGEIDIATAVTSDLAASLESSADVEVRSIEGNQTNWISMNTKEGPFADERVRQAMNYAVDKDAITDQLLGGYGTAAGQLYASSVFGFSPGVEAYPYDPDRAAELLAEAGYGPGEVQVEFVNFREELNPVWQAVAANLGDAGFDVSTTFDPNYFADVWQAGNQAPHQIAIRANNNLTMDADFALGLELDGERRGLYFSTPETDAAIAAARGESDPTERQALYDALNAELNETAPVLFLYSTDLIYGASDRIDWQPRADGAIYLADVTKTP
ncbi:ABC transporter substrate-binding protein [Agromyces aerolatus]|uniref:ABC transporter substrate-binding protein n=1 Tax=Agromyces sp. LY-1074 TaxID=3074080 RepID=UPI00285D0573|nr:MULTISPECIES: ABC transporter substrate-binding protein [unclassified Agromyces]MDR5701853.1 ABC transporter substrate-binding protein [Agromyces sp. LY-1074]MDR5708074.1 ABC transporter substrate-binding protein [Agromyces sp. LY-1358]